MSQKYLICLFGPTAVGKTALAIDLALHYKSEIISSDSRQFFKEMSIGTAVPSVQELGTVAHHFIQHKSIHEPYSVGMFEKEALATINELFQKHQILIMVGGSGLYMDAVRRGFDAFPKVNFQIRDQLNELYQQRGIVPLQRELKKCDPNYFGTVDIYNPQRLIRALEVFRNSGQPYSYFLKKTPKKRSFQTILLTLNKDRSKLYSQIHRRVDCMISEGLENEAEKLYPHRHLNALKTVGYKEWFTYFDGKVSRNETIEDIKKNTRRFAKRQLTWLRRYENMIWLEESSPLDNAILHIDNRLR